MPMMMLALAVAPGSAARFTDFELTVIRPPPGVGVAVGVRVSVAVAVAVAVAVGVPPVPVAVAVAVRVAVAVAAVAVGVGDALAPNAITRLYALTLPTPVAKSHPVVAGYAGSYDVFEVDSTP